MGTLQQPPTDSSSIDDPPTDEWHKHTDDHHDNQEHDALYANSEHPKSLTTQDSSVPTITSSESTPSTSNDPAAQPTTQASFDDNGDGIDNPATTSPSSAQLNHESQSPSPEKSPQQQSPQTPTDQQQSKQQSQRQAQKTSDSQLQQQQPQSMQPQAVNNSGTVRSNSISEPQAVSKIFVGGLSWETDEESLRRYFSKVGHVVDCVIMRDRHTGHPRGFGFVTFSDEESATAAASKRHELDGRQVEAKRAVPRNDSGSSTSMMSSGGGSFSTGGINATSGINVSGSMSGGGGGGGGGGSGGSGGGNVVSGSGQSIMGGSGVSLFGRQPSAMTRFNSTDSGGVVSGTGVSANRHHTTRCKVFVGGLPSGCGVEEFRCYFSQFGEVVDAQVMIDHNTGNSRGFGFVTFANEAVVAAVVGHGRSNTDHEILGKCVEVKRAEPKGPPANNQQRNAHRADNSNAGSSVGVGVAGVSIGMGGGPIGPGCVGGGDVGGGIGGIGGPGTVGGGVRGGGRIPVGGGPGGRLAANAGSNGVGPNSAAAAAAAYYSNYPTTLAEQYGAYYSNPHWQQYFAAMGYNYNQYPQGFNPYQQIMQAYANSGGAGGAAVGGGGGGGGVSNGVNMGMNGNVGGVNGSSVGMLFCVMRLVLFVSQTRKKESLLTVVYV